MPVFKPQKMPAKASIKLKQAYALVFGFAVPGFSPLFDNGWYSKALLHDTHESGIGIGSTTMI